MLYREIMAVCSEIHTKHINTLCGQNVELPNIKLVVYVVTTRLYRFKIQTSRSSNDPRLITSFYPHILCHAILQNKLINEKYLFPHQYYFGSSDITFSYFLMHDLHFEHCDCL